MDKHENINILGSYLKPTLLNYNKPLLAIA